MKINLMKKNDVFNSVKIGKIFCCLSMKAVL